MDKHQQSSADGGLIDPENALRWLRINLNTVSLNTRTARDAHDTLAAALDRLALYEEHDPFSPGDKCALLQQQVEKYMNRAQTAERERDALKAEVERLRRWHSEIAMYGLTRPAELPETQEHYHRCALNLIGMAQRALDGDVLAERD